MSSNTSSANATRSLSETVADAFTSHEYNDVTGCVAVNVVDALMAIANAIHRLAAVQEYAEERRAREELLAKARADAAMLALRGDGPGHA